MADPDQSTPDTYVLPEQYIFADPPEPPAVPPDQAGGSVGAPPSPQIAEPSPLDSPADEPPPEAPPPSLPEEPPIDRHDPFAHMRNAPWMNRKLSPSGRAAILLRRDLDAFPVIEGRDPNHADLDAIVKRTVDYIVPIIRRERATDMVYDELDERRAARLQKAGFDLDQGDRNGPPSGMPENSGRLGPFEELKQRQRGYPKPPEDAGNGSEKVKELRKEANYDWRHPSYHRYEFKDALCQLGMPGCSIEAAYEALQRYAVPGSRDPGVKVENEQDSMATFKGMPGGHVQTFVEPASLSIVNVTRPDHAFHDGYVQRQVVVEGDVIYLRTFGEGKNRAPEASMANTTMAKSAFEESTAGIRAALGAPAVPGKGQR
jgi:hypothetical protein